MITVVFGRELLLRPMKRLDRAFVASRWVHSYSHVRAGVEPHEYQQGQWRLVDALLDRSTTIVACSPTVDDAVFGFATCEPAMYGPGIVHYAYVMPQLRGHGLALSMMTLALGARPERVEYEQRVRCTHRPTRPSDRFRFDWYPLAIKPAENRSE